MDINNVYLKPVEVERIYNYLSEVFITNLFDNCDFEEVRTENIYLGSWDISQGHSNHLEENYTQLKSFLKRAKYSKNYVIVELG